MAVELETGSNRYVHNINSSKKWLGESIVVKAANTPIFVGVVTNVQLHREGSDFGCIIVSGYSATYRMETAHSCFSWNDTTIGDVVIPVIPIGKDMKILIRSFYFLLYINLTTT